jgi:hypothetical protein
LADGLTATLGAGTTRFGGSWNDQDIILATSACCGDSAIMRMSAAGGASTPVTKRQPDEIHQSPQFLPDQRRFIYVVTRQSHDAHWPVPGSRSALWLGSLDGTPRTEIMEVGSWNAVYAPPGYILHAKGHALIAQPVNPETLRPEGAAVVIAHDIDRAEVAPMAPMAVSPTGVLAYVKRPTVRLTWVDRTGRLFGHVGSSNLGAPSGHALASDGSRVAMERVDRDTGSSDIWLLDASRGTESRWTTTAGRESDPVWSPDGRRIVYTHIDEHTGKVELLVRDVEREESTRLFARDDSRPFASDWSKDGRFIVFTEWGSPERFGIWMMPVAAPDRLVQIARTGLPMQGAGTTQGRFSPDGRYIAYTADGGTGRSEVYVQALPPATGRWLVSSNGGAQPMWRGDGKELFFIANGDVMAAAVKTSPVFSSETAVPLFHIRGGFTVAPDGQRFLVSAVEGDVSPIAIVVNWAAALQKRREQ